MKIESPSFVVQVTALWSGDSSRGKQSLAHVLTEAERTALLFTAFVLYSINKEFPRHLFRDSRKILLESRN